MFSTTDNGCISDAIKLPIASTKVCHRSPSFGSGLLRSRTFCSVGCDCFESLSLSPSAFNNIVYSLQWCRSKWTRRFVVFLQYETEDKKKLTDCFVFHWSSIFTSGKTEVFPCAAFPRRVSNDSIIIWRHHFYNPAIKMCMRKYRCIDESIYRFIQI